MLNVKKRSNMENKLKILVYGRDKSGKSTFVDNYVKEHNLKALVLDIEDTNYGDLDIINDIDLSSDVKAFRSVDRVIKEFPNSEYDTLVIDGIDTLIESFISNANGLKCYADRSKTFGKVLRKLQSLNCNLIFIGQAPVDLDYYKGDESPNKTIIRLNAFVNTKYYCFKQGSEFKVECVVDRK